METSDAGRKVPVWMIGTESDKLSEEFVPPPTSKDGITPERLTQLRDGLAAFMDTPLVSMEAHTLPSDFRSTGGRLLEASSPLARHLADLVRHSQSSLKSVSRTGASGEVLYRMVVPAKVARMLGAGVARSMPSALTTAGIHGGILSTAGLVGQATFVPVGVVASVAGGAGLVTVAPPLVLLAIATAATVHAEKQRRLALRRITSLLGDLKQSQIHETRDALMASSRAVDKATAVLLDEGRLGHSLGLDSAVHAIDAAVEAAARRSEGWVKALEGFGNSDISPDQLERTFPGIEDSAGEFRGQLRMAAFTIAMKRRVAVLQAVDHAQQAPELTLPRFASNLKLEHEAVDELEKRLTDILQALARLQIGPSGRLIDRVLLREEVKTLLKWPARLRELAEAEAPMVQEPIGELELPMFLGRDGSVRVLEMSTAPPR